MKIAFLLFVVGALAFCEGKPKEDKDDEFTYDYYSDSDPATDDYYQDEYENNSEQVDHRLPKLLSSSKNLMVNEGETIRLPCLLDYVENFVLIWKHGDKIVAIGNQIIDRTDTRVKLEQSDKGNHLVISLAETSDAGDYECQISAYKPIELKHNVRIREAPEVRPDPASGVLVVRQGESATLGCEVVKGNPAPEIRWRRKHRLMPSGEEELRGLSVTFGSTNRHHSGVYICSADNGFGVPVEATIKLDVHHKPEVEVEQTFIHTRESDETEVICTVHSSPQATITWYRDEEVLDPQNTIMTSRGNRHTLVLPGIRDPVFGKYTCKAENEFGADQKITEVSGKASPANVKSSPYGEEKTRYTMEWVAESITNITEFKVEYKREDLKEWGKPIRVIPTDNGDHFFTGKFILKDLRPATRYIARIASMNEYGYNDFGQQFMFATQGAEPIQQPSTGGASALTSSLVLLLVLAPLWGMFALCV